MRVQYSQLAVSRAECAKYIRQQMLQKDRLPLATLYKLKFITMSDISTPTSQILIGRMLLHDEEMRYILSSNSQGYVVMHLSMKTEMTHLNDLDICRTVSTQLILPLSMNKRTPNAIHIPDYFSKASSIIPNEVTWEFLNQVYAPAKFPVL